MAFKVHHAVAKKAAKLNITLAPFAGEVVAQFAGFDIAFDASATAALDKAITALTEQHTAIPAPAREAWLKANPPAVKKARKASDEDEGDEEQEDEDTSEEDEDTTEAPEAEEEEEGDEGRSKVKKKYKQAYRPHKNRNGDELSHLISNHVAERNAANEVVTPVRIDEDRLKKFAVANGVWKPTYSKLNVGMRRMNIANRLRAKVKGGHDIVWAK